MRLIHPNNWKPVGVDYLEDAAAAAVRALEHRIVIAGPGAGKTELLAQRACYLLQTGLCPSPKRILAISFKRDAARNLQERVNKRCAPELTRRFDSMTFDAFAKNIVDRFLRAVPADYRPSENYELATQSFSRAEIATFLGNLRPDAETGTQLDVAAISRERFLRDNVHPFRLGIENNPNAIGGWAASKWWDKWLKATPSILSFPMIGRLAELLLRTNPLIRRALQATYAFVFMDEFQDTTKVQFDVVETAFTDSSAVISAVGDNKQRIMGWAEALDDAFTTLEQSFPSKRLFLKMNFRSSPELVAVQQHLIQQIDPGAQESTAARPAPNVSKACQIWLFDNAKAEAIQTAGKIAELCDSGVLPSNICVLVKQRVDLYAASLIEALKSHGIAGRNEANVQNLLVEPVVELTTPLIACIAGDYRRWSEAQNGFLRLQMGSFEEATALELTKGLAKFVRRIGRIAKGTEWDAQAITLLLKNVLVFLGTDRIRGAFPQYQQGQYFSQTAKEYRDLLVRNIAEGSDLKTIVSGALGLDSVPIMTIHKSKGLEYDAIFFLGLEDDAFWSFKSQREEDLCSFFVAFSRAENRVFFTFSENRVSRPGYAAKTQTRNTISSLHDMLKNAGATEVDYRTGTELS